MKYDKMRNDVFPVGTRFNRLVVVEVILPETGPINITTIRYRCKCDCGNEKITRHEDLRRGMTQSCGCLHREIMQAIRTTHGDTPGGKHHRLYGVWWSMNERCKCTSQRSWKSYGRRGIKVCDEWKSPHGYDNFKTWAYNNGYHDQPADTPRMDLLTIDRKDPDGDYCPNNCRWIPMWMQFANQRFTHLYSINGEVLHAKEVERKYGVKYSMISNRVNQQGWSDDAVSLSIECPELGLHKDRSRNYRDKDGFYVLKSPASTERIKTHSDQRRKILTEILQSNEENILTARDRLEGCNVSCIEDARLIIEHTSLKGLIQIGSAAIAQCVVDDIRKTLYPD